VEVLHRIDRVGTVRTAAEMRHAKREYRYIAGHLIHCRLENVTYWQKKAGWFDGDASMKTNISEAQSNRLSFHQTTDPVVVIMAQYTP
jgi:hypothetical protein